MNRELSRRMTTESVTRSGATTVEFALTAPLLFLLFFAGIEFSRANMLLHTAAIAATEGARRGIISGATADECQQAAVNELGTIGVRNAKVIVSPSTINDDTEMISVGVMIPMDLSNGYVTPRFFLGKKVIKVVSITREAKSNEDSVGQAQDANADIAQTLSDDGDDKGSNSSESRRSLRDILKAIFGKVKSRNG